ncbi:MAG: Asp-tRNA(Asn)/Glu-tRNA(Gln) amidotransferase subunit GatB [Bdellovibrionales bacterium]
MSNDGFELVIGIEVHVQLKTNSKLFCGCGTKFSSADNENTCPVCLGLPGALPVLNEKAVDYAVRTGLALNCKIAKESVFSRKNYFYPDSPNGYQISQYDKPICGRGYLNIRLSDGSFKKVGITRAHLEADAGKSTHHGNYSLINLNRSSMPLLEVVSDPDLRSASEAATYVRSLRSLVQYLDVCDGNLEEGSLRADCNVSVRKFGATEFGTRVELKNINSFRFIEKAIDYERARQVDLILSGNAADIVQETRLYDSDKNKTYSMRSKEEAEDYRYFPEPDLKPCYLSDDFILSRKKLVPELANDRAARFISNYKLSDYDAYSLVDSRQLADYFEECLAYCKNPKAVANWILSELLRRLNDSNQSIEGSRICSAKLGQLVDLVDKKVISGKIAKTVFAEMWQTKSSASDIIDKLGLKQISDENEVLKIAKSIVDANPKQLEEYRSGKEKVFGFFVGQVMKKTNGQVEPGLLNKLLKEILNSTEST